MQQKFIFSNGFLTVQALDETGAVVENWELDERTAKLQADMWPGMPGDIKAAIEAAS